jgi:hypothetical protein
MVAPREPATSPPAASSQWYGWQILLSDAAVFSFAGLTHNASVAYGWVGGGAIVHLGHGNVGRGLASAVLRAGLPIIGLALGAASASGCTGDWCGLGEVVVGGAIGMVSAELIDVALLAHDSAPPLGHGQRGAAQPRRRGLAGRARRSIRGRPRPRRSILIPGSQPALASPANRAPPTAAARILTPRRPRLGRAVEPPWERWEWQRRISMRARAAIGQDLTNAE